MKNLVLVVLMLNCSALPASDVVGKWKLRIDGGGEIYSAVLTLKEAVALVRRMARSL